MIAAALFSLFALILIAGVPIGVALGIAGVIALLLAGDTLAVVPTSF